jgi:hypothetical protein
VNKLYIEINGNYFPIETNDKVLSCFIEHKSFNQSYVDYVDEKIIIKSNFFSQKLEVPNVCRYIIKKENDNYILAPFKTRNPIFRKSKFNDNLINYQEDIKDAFVLILESPHYHEYNQNPFEPIAPAQDTTGNNIQSLLPGILNKNKVKLELNESEYRLIIINPIPFQTSLNYFHKQPIRKKDQKENSFELLRNNTWEILWNQNKNYKKDFIENLNVINPKIILNCCTSALSNIISSTLLASNFNFVRYKTCHPSYWDKINGEICIYKIK